MCRIRERWKRSNKTSALYVIFLLSNDVVVYYMKNDS